VTPTNEFAWLSCFSNLRSLENFSLPFEIFPHQVTHSILKELLMVGPRDRVWKVLRATDGERFVSQNKFTIFRENFDARKNNFFRLSINSLFRVFFMRSSILSQESCLHFQTRITVRDRKTFSVNATMDHLWSRKQLQKVFGSL